MVRKSKNLNMKKSKKELEEIVLLDRVVVALYLQKEFPNLELGERLMKMTDSIIEEFYKSDYEDIGDYIDKELV